MTGIVKSCKRGHQLISENLYKNGTKKNGEFKYSCRLCTKMMSDVWREKNKEKLRENSRAYAAANRDKMRAYSKKSRQKLRSKCRERAAIYFKKNKEKIKLRSRKYIENISDSYVKSVLSRREAFLKPRDFNNKALIELARTNIKIKRILANG
jgi:hypothetical protein